MNKKDLISFEKEYDNPFEELHNDFRKSQRNLRIISRLFFIFIFLWLSFILGSLLWGYYNDKIMENRGEEFCESNGFKFSDGNCLEFLDSGLVAIHEINYFDNNWKFVKGGEE